MPDVAVERGVRIPGPETLEIERDMAVSGGRDDIDSGLPAVGHRRELSHWNLDPCGVAVVPHPEGFEPQPT